MSNSKGFRILAGGLERKDPKIASPLHEHGAAWALRDSGLAPDLPWRLLRPGKAGEEPDFVLEGPDATIVAGIEVTELANEFVRLRNAKLRELQTGRHANRTAGPKKRRRDVPNEVSKAFSEAGGAGSEYQYLQKFVPIYTEEQLQQAIIERIEAKKAKRYYEEALYPIHLIVHIRDYVICKGDVRQAIKRAAAYDAGKFEGVWYVDHDWSVVNSRA